MKNLVNYIDDFIDENGIYETVIRQKNDINKDAMKAYKKMNREEEIRQHGKPISYNHTFKDKTKYNRKDKHKHPFK